MIFWEDLKAKNSPPHVFFASAFKIIEKYLKVYEESIKLSDRYYERRFVGIFYCFVRLIGFKYPEYRKYRNELSEKFDCRMLEMAKIDDKLVNIHENFILMLLSVENQSFGKIEFASHQAKSLLNYIPSELVDKGLGSLMLPRKIKRI